jgi:hypothetical protein
MLRKLHIARGEVELGTLTEAETFELLDAGFLLSTDVFWTAGMEDWKLLAELKPQSTGPTNSAGLVKLARQQIAVAGGAFSSEAARLKHKLKSVADGGKARLTESTSRTLEAFLPQIQKLVSHQLVSQSAAHAQAALRDDEFMRKVFGATYDCLPRPVRRFVTEPAFIQFCLERRWELLGLRGRQAVEE